MTLSVSIVNRERPPTTAEGAVALVGVTSSAIDIGGDELQVYEFEPGQDISASVGYGPPVDLGDEILRQTPSPKLVIHRAEADIDAVIGAVTESPSGTGPTITVTGDPVDSFSVAVQVVKAGPLGTGVVRVSLDGVRIDPTGNVSVPGEDIPIPTELPASFTSAVDLTTLTLADLNGLTVIATSDIGGPITTTFTTPSSVADIAAQITAAAAAGTDEFAAQIVSEKYLQIYSMTNGDASTLSFGSGTANTLLGLTPSVTYEGTPATYEPPNSGLVIGFPSGNYVYNTVYTAAVRGPRASVSSMNTALSSLRLWATENGVELAHVFVLAEPVDGAETRQFLDALSARRAEFYVTPAFKFAEFYVGSSQHTASATKATNDTNIATNDAAVKAAILGHVDEFVTLAHGDCYFNGRFGRLRRSLTFWLGLFESRERLSADPGNRSLPGFAAVSLVAPDGRTKARDEIQAVHKMQASRCTVAQREAGADYITRGVTRANPTVTKAFKHLGVINGSLAAARVLRVLANAYQNTDLTLAPNGTLLPEVADGIERAITAELQSKIVAAEHMSDAIGAVNRTANIADTETLELAATLQHKGQIIDVSLTLGVVGQLSITERA